MLFVLLLNTFTWWLWRVFCVFSHTWATSYPNYTFRNTHTVVLKHPKHCAVLSGTAQLRICSWIPPHRPAFILLSSLLAVSKTDVNPNPETMPKLSFWGYTHDDPCLCLLFQISCHLFLFLLLPRADYWKSQPKKFCDYCKCWIADNRPVWSPAVLYHWFWNTRDFYYRLLKSLFFNWFIDAWKGLSETAFLIHVIIKSWYVRGRYMNTRWCAVLFDLAVQDKNWHIWPFFFFRFCNLTSSLTWSFVHAHSSVCK